MDDLLIEGAVIGSAIAGSSMRNARHRPQTAPHMESQISLNRLSHSTLKNVEVSRLYKSDESTVSPHIEKVQEQPIRPRPKSQHFRVKTKPQMSRQSSARKPVPQSFRGTLHLDGDEPFSQSRQRKPSPAIVAVKIEAKHQSSIDLPYTQGILPQASAVSSYLDYEQDEDKTADDVYDLLDREDSLFPDIDDEASNPDLLNAMETGSRHEDFPSDLISQNSKTGSRDLDVLMVDQDNEKYHDRRRAVMNGLSEKDTAALRLGRLVLSTVLNQPEVSAADSISRFFTDIWLSKNGSELTSADTMSMTLMSNIQRSVAEYDPGVDAGPLKTATCQKSVAAVACEALDALIMVFGKSNPVLADIREALMPVLFMTDPPPTPQPLTNPTPESARGLFPLTGKGYMALPTFCEDASLIVEDLSKVEKALDHEKREVLRLQNEVDDLATKYKESCAKSDESYGKLTAAIREQERLKGVHKKLKDSYNKLTKDHENTTAQLAAETSKHEKLKKDHSLLILQEAKTKEKYYEATHQKRQLEEEKAAMMVDLNFYKTENGTLHNSISDLKEGMESLKRINAKTGQRLQELENYKASQSLLRKETLLRIQKAVSHANSRFTMSSKVHSLLRDAETDVVVILEEWNVELLERNSALELAMSDGYVENKIREKTTELTKAHDEELKAATYRLERIIESERKKFEDETAALKTALDTIHKDVLEMQIERNIADKNFKTLTRKYDAAKQDLDMRKKANDSMKVTLVEQVDMMVEDHMFEEKCRALMKWKQDADELINELQRKNSEYKMRIKKDAIEVAEHHSEMQSMREEFVANKEKMAVLREELLDLKYQLEEQSTASSREQALQVENMELQKKLTRLEASFNDFNSQFHSQALDKSKDKIALEARCMGYESEVGLLLRHMETTHNDLKRKLLDKERELKVAKDIADETSKRFIEVSKTITRVVGNYECQLMGCEDSLTQAATFFRKMKLDAIKTRMTTSAPTSFNDYDVMDETNLDSVLEALAEEKRHHQATKDKYKAMISQQETKQCTLIAHNEELEHELKRVTSSDRTSDMVRLQREEMLHVIAETASMTLRDIESRALNTILFEDKETNTDEFPTTPHKTSRGTSNSKKHLKVKTGHSQSSSGTAPHTPSPKPRRVQKSDDTDDSVSVLSAGSVPSRVGTRKASKAVIKGGASKHPKKSVEMRTARVSDDMTDTDDDPQQKIVTSTTLSNSPEVTDTTHFDFMATETSDDQYIDHLPTDDTDDNKARSVSNASEHDENSETRTPSCSTSELAVGAEETEGPLGGEIIDAGEEVNIAKDTECATCVQDLPQLIESGAFKELEQHEETEEQEDEWNDGWFNMGAPDPNEIEVEPTVNVTAPTPRNPETLSVQLEDENSLDLHSIQHSRCESEEEENGDTKSTELAAQPSIHSVESSLSGDIIPIRRLSSASAPVTSFNRDTAPSALDVKNTVKSRPTLGNEVVSNTQGIVFDASIGTKSSANYFFDILERRERRNLFENSRLRVIVREASALVDRLEKKLLTLSAESLSQPKHIISRGSRTVDAMREDIADNKWVFSLKPEHMAENAVLKDAIVVAGNMRTVEGLQDDLASLQHCKQAFGTDKKLSGAVATMKRAVMDHRDDAMKRSRERTEGGKSAWQAVLYRNDGTVDTNMSLFGWDKTEKIEIYKEIVSALRLEIDDKTKAYTGEICRLKDTIASLLDESQEKSEAIERLTHRIDTVERNSVSVPEFEEMAKAVQDVTSLLRNLTAESLRAEGEKSSIPTSTADGRQSFRTDTGSGVPNKDGVGAPTATALYGNPALLWHKIAANQKSRTLSAKRRLSVPGTMQQTRSTSFGVLEGGPSISGSSVVDVFHENHSFRNRVLGIQSAEDSVMNDSIVENSVDDTNEPLHRDSNSHGRHDVKDSIVTPLLRDLNLACEGITERVLLPSALRISKPLVNRIETTSSVGYGYGEDNFRSQVTSNDAPSSINGMSISPLVVSKDILHYSDTLNKEINSHIRAIKQLEQKQHTLFDHNLRSLSMEAERYYAEAVKIGESSDNLRNWASVFAKGSASPVVLSLLQRCEPEEVEALRTRGGIESTPHENELPVIEKRSMENMTVQQFHPVSVQPPIHSEILPVSEASKEVLEEHLRSFQFLPDFRNTSLLRQKVALVKRKSKKYYRR